MLVMPSLSPLWFLLVKSALYSFAQNKLKIPVPNVYFSTVVKWLGRATLNRVGKTRPRTAPQSIRSCVNPRYN